ncbi:MAG: hypothetical protein QNJ97_21360 [Myxococcota bacterium]|nr:hypothetical protein [Myxococcota bacterium]
MTLEEFQKAALMRKKSNEHRPRRYSLEERAFAIEYAEQEFESGATKPRVLESLGVTDKTLSTWMGKGKPKTKRFRRVSVKSEIAPGAGLQITTPSGYRIEGLCVESAVSLLRLLK